MSEFWEIYKKRVAESAGRLPEPPKEISQNVLWLKAAITEKLQQTTYKNRGNSMYVGTGETFGFKEELVNYIIHYAYEAGVESRRLDFENHTKNMKSTIEKIKGVLEDDGWIDECECY